MDQDLISQIVNIIFFVVIGFLALISVMAVYVLIRYGQNKVLTIFVSLAFGGVFFLGTLTAFLTLQKLF